MKTPRAHRGLGTAGAGAGSRLLDLLLDRRPRMVRRIELPGIGSQVVILDESALPPDVFASLAQVCVPGLPIASAAGAGGALDEQPVTLIRAKERAAVRLVAGRYAGGVEDRRGDVGVRDQMAGWTAVRYAGAPHVERELDARDVGERFSEQAVVAPQIAVVREKERERVSAFAGVLELLEDM